MNSVNQTLYIPLYGKAFVSRKGIILRDPKAEAIWAEEGFPLKGKSRSKWLAYYMGVRSAVFDRWLREQMEAAPDALILHMGCGLDSRCERVGTMGHIWYDIDFPEVIIERRRYYRETAQYKMLGADVRDGAWLSELSGEHAIVIMEGVSMYLRRSELTQLLARLCDRFENVHLLMDCYTEFAARASRFKNPIHDVGVTQVYGLDDPEELENSSLHFLRQHDMTPPELTEELKGLERSVFRTLYAGTAARKMYRLYEYRGKISNEK